MIDIPLIEEDNNNKFNDIYKCNDNVDNCLIGIIFPGCLFGKIYNLAGFGSPIFGCIKYYTIQLIIIFITFIILYDINWFYIYGPKYNILNTIPICSYLNDCKSFYLNGTLIDSLNITNLQQNDCIVPKKICHCLDHILTEKCIYESNINNTISNVNQYTILLNSLSTITVCSMYGLFLGYYRKKIAEKFNLQSDSFTNFVYHCIPFINPCALCQEANTIEQILYNNEVIMPVAVI